MAESDPYASRRLLYKCDNSITKIYTNLIKIMSDPSGFSQDQSLKAQLIKQIDVVSFQIFKYKNALISLQKDFHHNEQAQIKQDQYIEKSKQQIKLLTEDVKSAEIVQRRKLKYNQIAKSVKQFDTNSQLNEKIKGVETELEKLQSQYNEQKKVYEQKQRCLKLALSALRLLMKEDSNSNFSQSPVAIL